MIKSFSLDHLNATRFEEFCYDLLFELGFVNINWRKGTGFSSSPSDRGRDIECQLEKEDIDGKKYLEKWFVECKHYIKGVPPEKLQNVLSWANSERPDIVLIIVSNFLSNSTIDYLEDYQKNNNPPFRIKLWQRTDIERLSIGKSKLLRKYNIMGKFPFLSIMHPAHLLYLKKPPINTLEYFFKTLDKLDTQKRDEIMGLTYIAIIKPRLRRPVTREETLKELIIDKISYESFREKCRKLTNNIEPSMIVLLIVVYTLEHIFDLGDTTSIDEKMEAHKSGIEDLQISIKTKDVNREILETLIKKLQNNIKSIPDNVKKHYALYEYFCENVVEELFKQPLIEVIEGIKLI
ncbi:restriction endonuclease [candidate division WOR-3 bacterium]|nr:restriction endonuclease [candidate division WOR-3 bacterium]